MDNYLQMLFFLFQIPPVVDLVSRNGSWLVSGARVVAGDIENKKKIIFLLKIFQNLLDPRR